MKPEIIGTEDYKHWKSLTGKKFIFRHKKLTGGMDEIDWDKSTDKKLFRTGRKFVYYMELFGGKDRGADIVVWSDEPEFRKEMSNGFYKVFTGPYMDWENALATYNSINSTKEAINWMYENS